MPPNPDTALKTVTGGGSALSAIRELSRAINLIVGALNSRTVTPITLAGQLKYTFGSEGDTKVLMSDASGNATWQAQSAIDHGSLGGLGDDDHTQYALLAGRSGGQ